VSKPGTLGRVGAIVCFAASVILYNLPGRLASAAAFIAGVACIVFLYRDTMRGIHGGRQRGITREDR
jgi:hypothetical protein